MHNIAVPFMSSPYALPTYKVLKWSKIFITICVEKNQKRGTHDVLAVPCPKSKCWSLLQIYLSHSTMADDQQFCLRWNDFQTNMVASFKHLRDEKSFCDVTIATEVF